MCSHGDNRPDTDAFIRNMRREMPLAHKLKLVLRNTGIKITRLQGCCGHPSEPGC